MNFKISVLLVIVIITSFSCNSIRDLKYQTNQEIKSKEYYLKMFEKNDFQKDKLYFSSIKDNKEQIDFTFNLMKRNYKNFYGVFLEKNNVLYFKDKGEVKYGCKQLEVCVEDDSVFPFTEVSKNNWLLKQNLKNINGEKLTFTNKKMIVLLYHHSSGKAFFKDIKNVKKIIDNSGNYDYAVVFADFFN